MCYSCNTKFYGCCGGEIKFKHDGEDEKPKKTSRKTMLLNDFEHQDEEKQVGPVTEDSISDSYEYSHNRSQSFVGNDIIVLEMEC